MTKTISVIGGDLRQLTLYKLLKESDRTVYIQGFDKLTASTDDAKTLLSADIIILPMPVTTDGTHVNSVYSSHPMRLDEIIAGADKSAVIFGGRISDALAERFTARGLRFCDYLKREELAVKNAVATAEGAIGIAMSETPFTVCGSECLVLGYGRIARVLTKMLGGIGARVTVSARSHAELAMAECCGFRGVPLKVLKDDISSRNLPYDVVFNTIPAVVLDDKTLAALSPDTLIIDLASRPGGVDFETAKKLGLKVIWALSLPGKVAPETSGKIIRDTIVNILNDGGVSIGL